MLVKKEFWIVLNVAIVVFWLAALALVVSGHSQHRLVLIATIVLVAHALEWPLAFGALRGRGVPALKTLLMTLLFGFTWWLPVRRGVYAG